MTIARLAFGEKVAYALGDAASGMYWRLFEVFLLAFYTDVFGLSPVAAGLLFLVSRVWDAVNDPLMGIVADRTRTRWGRYRPWILWMALPLAVSGVLMFTTPALSEDGRLVWAYATYILMMTAYTAANIPYSALMGVLTPRSDDRTSVSAFRFVGAFSGGFLVLAATMPLVRSLGGGDDALGWQRTMMVYGGLAALMLLGTFLYTRERVEPLETQSHLTRDVGLLFRNDAMIPIVILGTVVLASLAIRGSVTLYYLRYYVGAHDLRAFGVSFDDIDALISTYLTAGGLAALAGVFLTGPLSRVLSKRTLYMASMASASVLSLGFFFLPGDALTAILTLHVVSSFVIGPTAPLMFAMFADVADYGEWKSGRRTTGLVFSGAIFATKLGSALGGFAAGGLLAGFGYVANQAQTEGALLGILLMMSVIPSALALLGVGVMFAYPLTDERMASIGSDLEARRAAAA